LRESGVEFDERDYSKEPLTREELEELIGDRPVADFLSSRNETYKKHRMDERPPGRDAAIDHILRNPNLLRRPILALGRRRLAGFKSERWQELLRKP